MTILCLLANLFFSQTSLTLSLPLIELKMPAGVMRKFDFTLINQGKTTKIPLAVYPVDIIQTMPCCIFAQKIYLNPFYLPFISLPAGKKQPFLKNLKKNEKG